MNEDYAAVLHFDAQTERHLKKMTAQIAQSSGNDYMIVHNIPPHITVAFFNSDNQNAAIDAFAANIEQFGADEVQWASLGVFVPRVLFAAPVMCNYLLNMCATANKVAAEVGTLNHLYTPDNWVAHTTLATDLNHSQLLRALDKAVELFAPLRGNTTRLALAKCNAYKQVAQWDL